MASASASASGWHQDRQAAEKQCSDADNAAVARPVAGRAAVVANPVGAGSSASTGVAAGYIAAAVEMASVYMLVVAVVAPVLH